MLSQRDVKLLKEMFVTRNEFQDRLDALHEQIHGDLLEFKDEILNQVRSLREEFAVLVGYKHQITEHEERLNEHDTEIGALKNSEKKKVIH